MDKRKSEIHEHQSAIDELDLSIERQTAELGRLLLQDDQCEIEGVKEPFTVGKEIQAEIAAKENRREEIRSALERNRQLEEQLQELEEEDKTFDKSRSELVVSLGGHAYRVYRTGSLKSDGFDGIFQEINEIDSELSEKEREVQSLSLAQDSKNLFKKLPGGARITLLKSRIVRLEKKRDSALERVGERLLETGKVEEIPDEQVRSVTSNIKQQEDRRKERIEQSEALTREKEELNQKIEAQAGSSSPDKALKQLETELKQQQDRLYNQNTTIGKAYLMQPSLESANDEEQQMVLNRIRELEQQKQHHQDKVNKLQSQLEIEELQDAMKKKEEQIAKLEKKISDEKQEVEQIRDEMSADNNRVMELRRMVDTGQEKAEPKKEESKKEESKKKAPSKTAKKKTSSTSTSGPGASSSSSPSSSSSSSPGSSSSSAADAGPPSEDDSTKEASTEEKADSK